MDEDSQFGRMIKVGLGAVGLGGLGSVFFLPAPYGFYVLGFIVVLALLLFGGYIFWRRRQARRERETFNSAIESQAATAPKTISDPQKRADLDRVRQKFQAGLQEYKSRGKDVYKLPWYIIIGESGSGKTEAIRHSGIDFPPGLQDELQGSGGTVNMDWWFTNRGIILDTAGSMLFNEAKAGEAPEWKEFLRLLKKARPHCPINGLFLVLSVESLIRDSADEIAKKASRLAQQLDLIQRTLDVRFPVYLVVTKSDLLTGFREFFENIDDPQLQGQMFGWSNPDPLDGAFRPDLVDQYLRNVAARLRRRRLALIRDTSSSGRLGDTSFGTNYPLGGGPGKSRRLDELDALFALPESVMRLAPRLRRYLETIFVAGEWSAKPVFLRGIYFTSSMREGKALDEAMALATGLPLDQLPEDRNWEKGRAYFLRDLFYEKVFRECGLVTRATNSLQLLRKRQLAIFGSAATALLAFLVFSGFAYSKLNRTVLAEAKWWQAGATLLGQGQWTNGIVSSVPEGSRYAYGGNSPVPGSDTNLVPYLQKIKMVADEPLSVGWIFKPVALFNAGRVKDRSEAQRLIFEASVLQPLLERTVSKLNLAQPTPADLPRHKEALLNLIRFQADGFKSGGELINGSNYLAAFLCYLTEADTPPDTNLVNVFTKTYTKPWLSKNNGAWPPVPLVNSTRISGLGAIRTGLEKFDAVARTSRTNTYAQLDLLNSLCDALEQLQAKESNFLSNVSSSCADVNRDLGRAFQNTDAAWIALENNWKAKPLTNIARCYAELADLATKASVMALRTNIVELFSGTSSRESQDFAKQVYDQLNKLTSDASAQILESYKQRQAIIGVLDTQYTLVLTNTQLPAYQTRWKLYSAACALAATAVAVEEKDVGSCWQRFGEFSALAEQYRTTLGTYKGPLEQPLSNLCSGMAANAIQQLKNGYVTEYTKMASTKIRNFSAGAWTPQAVTESAQWLQRLKTDMDCGPTNITKTLLQTIDSEWRTGRETLLGSMNQHLKKARFPLLLNAEQLPMKVVEVSELGALVQNLNTELQQAAWAGAQSVQPLKGMLGSYTAVVDGLMDGKTAATWELWFIPPPTGSADQRLIFALRYAQVSVGGANPGSWEDLTRFNEPVKLAAGTLDSRVKIEFRQWNDRGDVAGVDLADWGMIRLLRTSEPPVRLDDGLRWQFRVRPQTELVPGGKVIFEARGLKRPLPKIDDWPKQ